MTYLSRVPTPVVARGPPVVDEVVPVPPMSPPVRLEAFQAQACYTGTPAAPTPTERGIFYSRPWPKKPANAAAGTRFGQTPRGGALRVRPGSWRAMTTKRGISNYQFEGS